MNRKLTRRAALTATAAALATRVAGAAAPAAGSRGLGLVIHSFPVRTATDRDRTPGERFGEPFRFLEHARSLGAAGIQVGLGPMADARAEALRARAEAASLWVEGIASLPKSDAETPRFEAELRAARLAGAAVVRTVCLSGRRYETFDTLEAFRRFGDESARALDRAARVAVKQGVILAVENHKDWRADELAALLKKVGREGLGVCLDTGNSMALLEDPAEVVEALAPWTVTTHFKDMGVEPYRDGFRLSEVPLGDGVLDLPRMVKTLRAARPGLRFNLEMITRDPLDVPCLGGRYWATFPDLPARDLARALAFVRDHPPARPLPRVSPLSPADRLRAEDENVARCLAFARDRLGL
ncbi:MAG: TIM barrel protein [Isosphaeraceae bacterium]